jgi:hypothetical protein
MSAALRPLRCRPADPELHTLDIKHKDYYRRNRQRVLTTPRLQYDRWYEAPRLIREKWKLYFLTKFGDVLSNTTRRIIRREEGKEPNDWIWSRDRTVRKNDWILCVSAPGEQFSRLDWFFVDRVFKVPKNGHLYFSTYPYEIVQVDPPNTYPPPPFAIDRKLRSAFKALIETEGAAHSSYSPESPKDKTLKIIYGHYRLS